MGHHHLSRRKFIGQATCAAVTSTSLFSTLANLKFMNAASISNSATLAGGDYKALVCILLSGGSDSHNMLIPTDANQYGHYQTTRSNVAIPLNQINQLNGVDYGVHPSMTGIQDLFNNERLSFISNIGTLLQPMAKDEVFQYEQLLPLGLFSHSDQVQQWQTSLPHERSSIGWGGKIADLLSSQNSNDKISLNISLNGSNIFQTGRNTVEYSLDRDDGAIGIYQYKNPDAGDIGQLRDVGVDNIIDANYQDIFKKTYIDVLKTSRDAYVEFSDALDGAQDFSGIFDDTEVASQLEMIARTISARQELGMQRQIFFLDMGGWDHHDELLNSQEVMLNELSRAMSQFSTAMDLMGTQDCVTTFTSSEFGRTLTWNGNGTDHAWGGNVMVMGGPIRGGQIFGQYPSLELNSEYELGGGGIMLPTTSVDEYFAELALWFGVSRSDLRDIFPNAGNFFDVANDMPIGMFK
ncbi:DUF1501 domain-containing protein [Saprospiraceae bacterium]|nr:DUF1501 domain-containing protein [Saprospiraceae bacterium]